MELKGIDEENNRIKDDIGNLKHSIRTIDDDEDKEKSTVVDANSNEKRLIEEKNSLVDIDTKYFETEKNSNLDLDENKVKLYSQLDDVKKLIESNKNDEAIVSLENTKKLIDNYAESFSKNQIIKKDSIKRSERIKIIETEIISWKNLLIKSEKMLSDLGNRKSKIVEKLSELENQPQSQAEKKGQISESLRVSENERSQNENLIIELESSINNLRGNLDTIKESSIEIRERKASASATIDGLNKRRQDLLDRVYDELNISENNLLEFSNLEAQEKFPDALAQEELLDAKKRERDKLGSVNLRADEETFKYENEIKKMEKDRQDLVTAIIKLKESISELNQKGRERL